MQGPCHVIRSSAFAIEPGEDASTNPGRAGRALASHVATELRSRGWPVEGVIPEDFGWCVMLTRKPLRLWIGCGNRDGHAGEWMAFVVAEGGLLNQLLRRVDPAAEIRRVSVVLAEIMQSAPGVEAYFIEP